MLLYICELFGNIWFLYSTKSFLDICKILDDAELIYNLLSLDNFDNLHLCIPNWSNMELIKVFHPHLFLFLFLIGFICFGMYFLGDVSPIHTFLSTIIAPKQSPSEIGNIISLCSSRSNIWSRFLCLFTRVPLIFTNNESFTLGECIIWGWFSIHACNSLTSLSENISSSCFFGKFYVLISGIYYFNVRRLFWEVCNILYIACIEQ